MLLENNSSFESDTSFVSYVASIAVILSSKLHESRRQISLVSLHIESHFLSIYLVIFSNLNILRVKILIPLLSSPFYTVKFSRFSCRYSERF
jgi:hypothetical protein